MERIERAGRDDSEWACQVQGIVEALEFGTELKFWNLGQKPPLEITDFVLGSPIMRMDEMVQEGTWSMKKRQPRSNLRETSIYRKLRVGREGGSNKAVGSRQLGK